MAQKSLHGVIDDATSTTAFESVARAGYVTSGVLHLLIGYIIARLALGGDGPGGGGPGGGNADQSGALATLAAQTGGAIALWLAAVGLFGLALWRIAETIVGTHPNEPTRAEEGTTSQVLDRAQSAALAAIYCGLGISAVRFAMGGGTSDSRQNAGMSARLMQSGWGTAALLLVGAVVLAIGAYHVYKGASQKFLDDLTVPGDRIRTSLGTVGYIAKGAALAGAGLLVIVATVRTDPAKAAGLDAAVKTLGQAPFGQVLLLAAAAGVAAYGCYCFILARYGRM